MTESFGQELRSLDMSPGHALVKQGGDGGDLAEVTSPARASVFLICDVGTGREALDPDSQPGVHISLGRELSLAP